MKDDLQKRRDELAERRRLLELKLKGKKED